MNSYRPRTQAEINSDATKIFLFWEFICTCLGAIALGPVGAIVGFLIGTAIAYRIAP